MSRGPLPSTGLGAALPVARARGFVMLVRRSPGIPVTLIITGPGCAAFVQVRMTTRLHLDPADLLRDYRDDVGRLRLIPAGGPVSRELWLCNRYGTLRFFRVDEAGVTELDESGSVLVREPVTVPDPHPAPASSAKDGKTLCITSNEFSQDY